MALDPSLETTVDLVDRSRSGDAAARNRLIQRYLPLLTRWAHGRLPHTARDLSETYESALARMQPEQRELVVMRVELGMAHEDIAAVTGSPSPNAARMRVARARADLARQMSEFRPD